MFGDLKFRLTLVELSERSSVVVFLSHAKILQEGSISLSLSLSLSLNGDQLALSNFNL